MPQHGFRDGAEQDPAQSLAPVGAHRHQIGARLLDRGVDLVGHLRPAADHGLHAGPPLGELVGQGAEVGVRLRRPLLDVLQPDLARALDGHGRDGLQDTQQHDVQIERPGDLHDERQHTLGGARAVQRDQDPPIHGRPPSPTAAPRDPPAARAGRRARGAGGWASAFRAARSPRPSRARAGSGRCDRGSSSR